MIGFERRNYTTSEMFRGQDVCVAVSNGNVRSDLSLSLSLSLSPAITIGFERADYTYTEGEQVVVVVQKSGPLDSDIVFEVTGGGFSEQRTFPAGETGPNNISISLDVPDNNIALEPPRMIDLTLSVVSPADQVTLGLDRTSVTILDDDGESTLPNWPSNWCIFCTNSVGAVNVA